jgi:hypothetical protein
MSEVVADVLPPQGHFIRFVPSNAFHSNNDTDYILKGYLITLVDNRELVARVARRFMPRLKTQSEVATLQYLRENTPIPVPTVYYYDSNPYNRLGGEYILMSKVFVDVTYPRFTEDLSRVLRPHRLQVYHFPKYTIRCHTTSSLPSLETSHCLLFHCFLIVFRIWDLYILIHLRPRNQHLL